MRNAYEELFQTHGVDLVLAGHDHDYQRSVVIDDIIYVVSGAGAKLRNAGRASFTVVSERVFHYLQLEINENVLEATAISADGVVDEFSICHRDSNLR